MRNYDSYMGEHRVRGNRAFREALLFELINHMDLRCTPDGAERGADGAERPRPIHLTLEQKRRLRNEIYRIGKADIEAHNAQLEEGGTPWTELDNANVFVDAFFKTEFGKEYESRRQDWHRGGAMWNTVLNVNRWARDRTGTPATTLVSPYDPLFANADVFGADTDEIGYLIGNLSPAQGGERYLEDSVRLTRDANGNVASRAIKAVQLGTDKQIAPCTPATIQRIAMNTPYSEMEGELTQSGYRAIEHYVRKASDRKDVKEFMIREMKKADRSQPPDEDGNYPEMGPVSEDEAKFMGDVCRYLSERGYEFSVTVSKDNNLVARVESPKADIRILSRGDEQYQGRIYSQGRMAWLGVDGHNASVISHLITSEDRMDMIRWYFGETVRVRDERPAGMRYNHNVGESQYRVDGLTKDKSKANPVSVATSRSANNSVLFSIKQRSNGNGYAPISIMMKPSSSAYEEDRPEKKFSDSMKLGAALLTPDPETGALPINTNGRIPVDALLPGDRIERTNPDGSVSVTPDIKAAMPFATREYYRRVLVREKLNEWVEDAKSRHAEMVDIDGLYEQYRELYKLNSGYVPELSSDENVAEIQEKYWGMLASGEGTDEERLEAVREAYAEYVDGAFGSVRSVPKPGEPYDDTRAFSPAMAARYVAAEDAHGVPKNLAFIRNMLMELGDAYDPSMILGDDYNAAMMRNELIRFNPDTVRGTVSMGNREAFERQMSRMPFTRDMMLHVNRMLSQTGCDPRSIAVRVDDRGVMEYTGYVSTVKGSKGEGGTTRRDYFETVELYRRFQRAIEDRRIQDGEMTEADRMTDDQLMAFTSFDSRRSLHKLSEAERRELDRMPPALYEQFKDLEPSLDKLKRVHGYLGQIFEPDEYGAIKQDTVTEDKRIIVPGYDAHLLENDPDDPKPMRERLRLTGLEQRMRMAITDSVRRAVMTMSSDYEFDPHAAELNRVYRHSYETTLDEDYYRRMLPGSPDPTISDEEKQCFATVIETLRGRCRFPNEYGEGSTTMAQSYLEHPAEELSQQFDYYYSDLCDNHNLRVLDPEFDYIFDPNMTGTAKTQGIVRYLVKGVVDGTLDPSVGPGVNEDGTVTPVARNAHRDRKQCALASDPLFATMHHNSWDRRQMSMAQALTALGTPRNVGVAMLTMAGENFDDGMQISKAFAEAHPIVGADGQLRPLMEQDKLSDASGNKGVISRVVDPSLHSDQIASEVRLGAYVHHDEYKKDDQGRTLYRYKKDEQGNRIKGDDGRFVREPIKIWMVDVEFRGKTYSVPFERNAADRAKAAAFAIQKELGVYGRDDVMAFFRDNPDVDVTMAPFSGMSRTNGSIVRDMMNSPGDVVLDGKVVEGGMGHTNLIIVDMPADVKTHWYDEDAIKAGKGRKASGQLAWALQAKGCKAIMQEFYGGNQSSLDDMREYMISLGMDLDADSRPVLGYQEQTHRGEKRTLIKLPDMSSDPDDPKYMQAVKGVKKGEPGDKAFQGYVSVSKLYNARKGDAEARLLKDYYLDQAAGFMKAINEKGGFMELPFQLSFNTDAYVNLGDMAAEDSFRLQRTGQTYTLPDGSTHETYGMPILPIGLRSGQEFQDGTTMVHDFTNQYVQIHRHALTYMACQRQLLDESDPKARGLLEQAMEDAKAKAQASFSSVTREIADRRFNNKHNVIRDGIMASRLERSATAVWSADPRLNIDEVAMTLDHAKMLGLCNEDGELMDDARVLLWRDPILHDDNVRYLKVVIDKDVLGVRINPLIDKCFDGDFDGDSVGIASLRTKEARKEAYSAFAMETNLLQKGVVDSKGRHPIYLQTGLDVATMCHERPELAAKLEDLTDKINDLERKAAELAADPNNKEKQEAIHMTLRTQDPESKAIVSKELTGKFALNNLRKQYKKELDDWAHECLSGVGNAHIVVKSPETVMRSLQDIVDSGAKGNMSKLRDYADNLGVDYECEKDEKGKDVRVKFETVRDIVDAKGNPVTRDMKEGRAREVDMAIQETAAYKADNTSLGGTTAQEGVAAFRDVDLVMALELTYPITQAILQSKHDPKDAKAKDEIVRFWGRDVWNGYKLAGNFTGSPEEILKSQHYRETAYVRDSEGKRVPRKVWEPELDGHGKPMKNEDGSPRGRFKEMTDPKTGETVYERAYVKCTPEEWKKQMLGMMKALKVDINPEYVDRMAEAMTRTQSIPARSSYDGRPIKVRDNKGKCVENVMEPTGTIIGLTDFGREKGTLMDRVAYSGRLSAIVKEAMKSDDYYRNQMNEAGRGYELGFGSTDTVLGRVAGVASAKEAVARAGADATALERLQARAEALERRMDNSSMFASNSFRQEATGDARRDGTDSVLNEVVKKKRGTPVVAVVAPRPIGSRGCRLTEEEYASGEACMGEPQSVYEARKAGNVEENGRFKDSRDIQEAMRQASAKEAGKPMAQVLEEQRFAQAQANGANQPVDDPFNVRGGQSAEQALQAVAARAEAAQEDTQDDDQDTGGSNPSNPYN